MNVNIGKYMHFAFLLVKMIKPLRLHARKFCVPSGFYFILLNIN